MAEHIGIDGKSRSTKKMYFGVDDKARFIKKMYIGIDGIARLVPLEASAGDGDRIQIVFYQNGTNNFTIHIYEFDREFNKINHRTLPSSAGSITGTYNFNTDEIILVWNSGRRPTTSNVDIYDRKTLQKKRSATIAMCGKYGYYPTVFMYNPKINCYLMANYRDGWKSGDVYTAIFDSNFNKLDDWGINCSAWNMTNNAFVCKSYSQFYGWDGTKRITAPGSDSNGSVGASHLFDNIINLTTIFFFF